MIRKAGGWRSCLRLPCKDKERRRGEGILEELVSLCAKPIAAIGCTVTFLGIIYLGIQLKSGMTGGGGELRKAIAMIVGGAIVVGAAVYFGQLNMGALG